VLVSDEEDAAGGVADDVEAAADAGLHDEVGDFGVGLHDLLEVRTANAENVAAADGAAVQQGLAAVEEIEFSGELAVGKYRDNAGGLREGVVEDFEFSIEDDEHVYVALAADEEEAGGFEGFFGCVGAKAVDDGGAEGRHCGVSAWFGPDGLGGHDDSNGEVASGP
jgi:hypothetical protein